MVTSADTVLPARAFHFPNPKTTNPRERRVQRALEMVPGTLTWATLIGSIVVSFAAPLAAAVFIIAFDLYWILRASYISLFSVWGHLEVRDGKATDWLERCVHSRDPEGYAATLASRIADLRRQRHALPVTAWRRRAGLRRRMRILAGVRRETLALVPTKDAVMDWHDVLHVVLLPTAGEPADVIEPAIASLAAANFPKEQMIVLLATEEREDPATRIPKVEYLQQKFAGVFRDFIVTTHIVADGEMKCKASNAKFAAKELQKYLDERHIPYERVVFSNFDCDSVAHPEYFGALTYHYVSDPKRLRRAYQPMPMYHNNLWDTNAIVRIIVTGSSFWHLYQSTRREMVTFSSHSEPFATLVAVDFWPVNMISEDSVIYWKCLSYFDGDYEVQPIHLPVSLDAVLAPTYWQTVVNQYKQKRRWAYGTENFPVTMRAIWPNRAIGFWRKARITFEMLEGHYSWATTAFVITFLGWMPLLLGGAAFRESVLAHNLPQMTHTLMMLGMVGLLVSVLFSLVSLPPKPAHYPHWRYGNMLLQWLLVPVVYFFSALPAIDAQTRILTANYFGEFWVTEKMRKKTVDR